MKEQRSKGDVPPSPMREFLQTSIETTPIQSIRIGNSDIEVDLQKVPVDRVAEKFEERGLFWASVFLAVVLIISRTLEYETGLLFKAAVFTGCGAALIAAGVFFEQYLRRRRELRE